ncbi:recombinase family protein [Paraburkholderia nodosa]|uniref:recombinase family protein n=1 Tax=Paraburkholderia nodosa TaxID=392320 RepID=UPI001B80E10E|nr:recombinase family protein [Paraburkholderia nodosa]
MQDAIRSVFRQFGAIGSVRQTLLWFLEHGLQLPACTPRGEIQWKRPSYGTVYRILTSPIYGGAYAYGKTECTINYEGGEQRKRDRRKPRNEWLALIPNAHDGYVQWDEFERIQCAINGNLRLTGHAGAPKNGEALLAGLLRCRRCGSNLTLHYTGNRHDALRYSCHRGWLDNGQPRCIAFGGTRADAAIAEACWPPWWKSHGVALSTPCGSGSDANPRLIPHAGPAHASRKVILPYPIVRICAATSLPFRRKSRLINVLDASKKNSDLYKTSLRCYDSCIVAKGLGASAELDAVQADCVATGFALVEHVDLSTPTLRGVVAARDERVQHASDAFMFSSWSSRA